MKDKQRIITREQCEKAKQTILLFENQSFIKIYGKSRPCICCNKKIKLTYPSHNNHPESASYDGGVVSKISAGYGSTHDTNMYIIALCDQCIDKLKKENKIYFAGNYMGLY